MAQREASGAVALSCALGPRGVAEAEHIDRGEQSLPWYFGAVALVPHTGRVRRDASGLHYHVHNVEGTMNHSTRATRCFAVILALASIAIGCAISSDESMSGCRTNGGIEAVAPAAAVPLPDRSVALESTDDPTVNTADYLLESEAGASTQALTQAECDEQHTECFRACWKAKPPWPLKRGDAGHYKYCTSKCLAEYMACLAKAGLLKTLIA